MRMVRAFVRDNPGRWLWTAAVFALSALLPEYVFPALCFAAYLATLRGSRMPFSPAAKTALAFYGWLLAGVVYSGARVSALATLFLWGFFFLGWRSALHTADTVPKLDALLFCGALGGGAAGGIGILQMGLFHYGALVWKPLKTCLNPFWHLLDTGIARLAVRLWPEKLLPVLQRTEFIAIRDRAAGTFTNPVFYAAFLCMMVPLCAYGVFYFRSRARRLLSLFCLGLTLGGIACSYSRGPYLALAVVFAVLLFYGRKAAWKLLCALAVGIAGLAVAAGGVFRRLLTLFHPEDISVNTHAEIWRACFDMLRGHWRFGLGTGVGNVRDALHETYHINQPHAHNILLELLLENGIVGAALFCAMLVLLAVRLLRLVRQGGKARGTAVTLLAAVAGFCACGMTDDLFYGMKPLCCFLILLGLSECAVRVYAPDQTSEGGAA